MSTWWLKRKLLFEKQADKDAEGIIRVLTSTSLDEEAWRGKAEFVTENLKDLGEVIALVAEFNSSIIGFVDCIVFPSFWEGQKLGLITDFFVRGEYQAKESVQSFLKLLLNARKHKTSLNSMCQLDWKNAKARKLYGKYGFTEEQLLLERCRGSE